jgi:hypothetical protein
MRRLERAQRDEGQLRDAGNQTIMYKKWRRKCRDSEVIGMTASPARVGPWKRWLAVVGTDASGPYRLPILPAAPSLGVSP